MSLFLAIAIVKTDPTQILLVGTSNESEKRALWNARGSNAEIKRAFEWGDPDLPDQFRGWFELESVDTSCSTNLANFTVKNLDQMLRRMNLIER